MGVRAPPQRFCNKQRSAIFIFRKCTLFLKEKSALKVSCTPKFEMLPKSLAKWSFLILNDASKHFFININQLYNIAGVVTTKKALSVLITVRTPRSTYCNWLRVWVYVPPAVSGQAFGPLDKGSFSVNSKMGYVWLKCLKMGSLPSKIIFKEV